MPDILPASPDDADELSILVNAAYRGDTGRQGWTTEADLIDGSRTDAELLKAVIEKPGSQILKYVENGQIIGCVELRKEEDSHIHECAHGEKRTDSLVCTARLSRYWCT